MKQTLIIMAALTLFISGASVASAYSQFLTKPIDTTGLIPSEFVAENVGDNLKLSKFDDASSTCYMFYGTYKGSANPTPVVVSTSISCVKTK